MPILEGDIKLLKSQVMDDVDEGGGRATGNQVIDGASNDIFPDISQLDRAYGRVNLRKTFVKVNTPTTESYYGANVIISDPPDDQNVSCTLFTTNDGFDTRDKAKSRLESYVIAGNLAQSRLYGNAPIGSKSITLYQLIETPIPIVGEVYALSHEVGLTYSQFVRVTKVEEYIATFSDQNGDFKRRVVTLQISEALRFTFKGEEPKKYITEADNQLVSMFRKTSVADSAKYYGIKPLTLSASINDTNLKIDNVFSQLVPSSTIETPILLSGIATKIPMAKSGNLTLLPSSVFGGGITQSNRKLYLRGGVLPNSLKLVSLGNPSYSPKKDDGRGNILLPDGITSCGSIEYDTGIITLDATNSNWWNPTPSIEYVPATPFGQPAFTASHSIDLNTRGSVYTYALRPLPCANTLTVDFMSQGKWYRLYDRGDGTISGDETSIGSGTVNYINGGTIVTLGALPDVGSEVIFSWGSTVFLEQRTELSTPIFSQVLIQSDKPLIKGQVQVVVVVGGVSKTLTDAAMDGTLSGDGLTGKIEYLSTNSINGKVSSDPVGIVTVYGSRDYNTNIQVSHVSSGATVSSTHVYATGTANQPVVIAAGLTGSKKANISFAVEYEWLYSPGKTRKNGAILRATTEGNNVYLDCEYGNRDLIGSINRTTGDVTLTNSYQITVNIDRGEDIGGGHTQTTSWNIEAITATTKTSTKYDISIIDTISNPPTATTGFNAPIQFGIKLKANERVVPSSVVFNLDIDGTTKTYVDRGDGNIYENPSYQNGSAISVATINYLNGNITFQSWSGAVANLVFKSALIKKGDLVMTNAVFRTNGAPLRPASLYVQGLSLLDGSLKNATSNIAGDISGSGITGSVNAIQGVAKVFFNDFIDADTFKYNCVVQTTLPLNSDIIGIDAIRLPSDGRVPIIKQGDLAVIHHTSTTTSQTVVNNDVVDVGRVRLSRLRVFGNNGVEIKTGFTADLDLGKVTFTNVSGYSQPIKVEHRIEDMSIIADAQINGQLRLNRPLTHNYPLGSYISSALIIGDMKARVPKLFDQATFTGVWSDALIGANATGTYDDLLAPIQVTNAGAITERWAIRFTSSTAFEVMGEHVGVIATGNIASVLSPINPANNEPYFTISAIGWGNGWAVGNVLRFNTIGAQAPLWIARTIQQAASSSQSDSFTVLIRGDIDRI